MPVVSFYAGSGLTPWSPGMSKPLMPGRRSFLARDDSWPRQIPAVEKILFA